MRFIAGMFVFVLVLSACSGSDESAAECEEGPVESETGLIYEDIVCGDGAEAAGGASVTIEYTAELADGDEYASSDDQGGELRFSSGTRSSDKWPGRGSSVDESGGTRRITIPPDLAYGDAGFAPHVGPDETVVYEVTFLDVTED